MKKILTMALALFIVLGLSSCALMEFANDKKDLVELSDGETAVRWNLVANDNECRPVDSAYFEFDKGSFKYYEDGELKREGTHRITFFDIQSSNTPLHLNLNFGEDESGFSIYDYIDCYTEDTKEDIHQFTIVSEGYHVKPVRTGGVPVRDYHLSRMPYAFGTYVREGREPYQYENGKVNYLDCAKLSGLFSDGNGNSIYLVNNSYSASYKSSEYSKYTAYMRYESSNGSYLEGTVGLSWYEDQQTGERRNVALIYVMHGENEPGKESGTYAEPDYRLFDFDFVSDSSIAFSGADYFYDNRECDYDPNGFISGIYHKVSLD